MTQLAFDRSGRGEVVRRSWDPPGDLLPASHQPRPDHKSSNAGTKARGAQPHQEELAFSAFQIEVWGRRGSLPCLINNYTNLEPSYYTFDLSAGYDTGDDPANNYLKHIGIQLVVQNIMDRHPPFEYRISSNAGNPVPFDILKSDQGRTISLIVTKTW